VIKVEGGEKENQEKKLMPRKKEYDVASGFIVILYIIVFILFLKIFHIVSDPPDELDLLMNIAIAIVGGLVGWGIKWFMNLSNRIETLEQNFNDETKSIKNELVHLRDYLELSTRIARLEAKKSGD
jgi:uncharacterized membrane protein YvbJ